MKITVLREAGYEEAALGFSLSYNSTIDRAKEIMPKYAFGIPGENKFLESIHLWLDVSAPRFWWQEADTYRLTTKQSQSTMHTLTKRKLTESDFEPNIPLVCIGVLNQLIDYYNKAMFVGLEVIKAVLPEGFIQRRIWVMDYKTLQNIYTQRKNHKLSQWKYFCNQILTKIEHPEFITKEWEQNEKI